MKFNFLVIMLISLNVKAAGYMECINGERLNLDQINSYDYNATLIEKVGTYNSLDRIFVGSDQVHGVMYDDSGAGIGFSEFTSRGIILKFDSGRRVNCYN